jgi:hypothetical protein
LGSETVKKVKTVRTKNNMTQLTQLAQLRLWDFGTFGKCREALKIQDDMYMDWLMLIRIKEKDKSKIFKNFRHNSGCFDFALQNY